MKFSLIFAGVLLIIALVIITGHIVVYHAMIRVFDITAPSVVIAVRIVMGVLSVSFVLSSILIMTSVSTLGRIVYTGSAVWLGTLLWLFLASVIGLVIFAVVQAVGGNMVIARLVMGLMLVVAVGISTYGVMHGSQTKVVRYTVALPNLPDTWEGKDIALVSDTHIGNVHNQKFSRRVASQIAALRPEVVLIAGDFYDGQAIADYTTSAQAFTSIPSKYGTFFVRGNHEEFGDAALFMNPLREAGMQVLDDAVADIDGLQIVGVTYRTTTDPEQFKNILASIAIDRNAPSILIKHVPVHMDVADDAGINLQLSGHTHSGQVWPISLIVRRVYKEFAYGMHPFGDMSVITTSGAGTWGPPQRIGTNSEIVLITLTGK